MNDINHNRLFETCTALLQIPEQIEFIAAYFNTTTGHAVWLLDRFKNRDDSEFDVYSSELDQ